MRRISKSDQFLAVLGRALATLRANGPALRTPTEILTNSKQPSACDPTSALKLDSPSTNSTALPETVPTAASPAKQLEKPSIDEREMALAAKLMRVNHVGEICAQALYEGHALSTADPELRTFFIQASREEADHLAWTKARIDQLGGRTSMLNPLWYGGAFAIGYLSGRFGDRTSLGFMRETERQVEAHLDSHLDKLPEGDVISRQILLAMKEDEAAHAESAARRGANELPKAVHWAMQASAKLMTKTAYHL